MSVEIRFEPDGPGGLIAEGTGVLDAARRLGFQIPGCDGKGESDSCAVAVISGATLLSDLTEAERRQLSPERLAGGERLACQCVVERGGELVMRLVSQTQRARTSEERTRDLKKDFSELPFQGKIATLMQLETIAMTEALDNITDTSVEWGKKIFDTVLPSSGTKDETRRKTPPSAEQAKNSRS